MHTRWYLLPSGARRSTGVDHIQRPLVQGRCVGPTVKPLLWPSSWFRIYDLPCADTSVASQPGLRHCVA